VTSTVSDATGGLVSLPPIPQVPLTPEQGQALISDSLLQQIQHYAFGDGAGPSTLAGPCKKQGPFDFNGSKSQYPHVNALK
jgi:phospholipid/cholesterol/gamma-HCH transport system substrate-binding protein